MVFGTTFVGLRNALRSMTQKRSGGRTAWWARDALLDRRRRKYRRFGTERGTFVEGIDSDDLLYH